MQTMLTFLAVLLIDFTMSLRAGFNVCNILFSTSTIGWVQQGSILLYKKEKLKQVSREASLHTYIAK
jgi:hypothetical protein